jgi:hypothetical protein
VRGKSVTPKILIPSAWTCVMTDCIALMIDADVP